MNRSLFKSWSAGGHLGSTDHRLKTPGLFPSIMKMHYINISWMGLHCWTSRLVQTSSVFWKSQMSWLNNHCNSLLWMLIRNIHNSNCQNMQKYKTVKYTNKASSLSCNRLNYVFLRTQDASKNVHRPTTMYNNNNNANICNTPVDSIDMMKGTGPA